jgi:lipopolysaccharide exporter
MFRLSRYRPRERAEPANAVNSERSFAANVALMAGGTMFSSALLILAEPVTSRLFPPEAFGAVSTFYSGATILGMIACLRYEMALLLPREEEDASNIFVLCLSILSAITLLTGMASYIIGKDILGLLNMEELWPSSIWLFPIAVFLTGFEQLLRRWHTRHRRFNCIALSRSMQNIPRVLAEVGGGLAGFTSAVNLTYFRVFGLIGSPLNLFYNFLKNDLIRLLKQFSAEGLIRVAARYVKFPLYESVSMLVKVAALNLPVILLASFFGTDEAGLFAKAFYLLYLPALILGESTSQAFFQLSSHRKAMGMELGGLTKAIFTRMISLGVLPFAVVMLTGPEIFRFVLGPWWSDAGIYARIISPWMFAVLLNNSIQTLFGTLELQGVGLLFNLLLMTSILSILLVGGLVIKDPMITTILFSAANVIIILMMSSYMIRKVGVSMRQLSAHFFQCLFMAIPTLAITAWVKWGIKAQSGYVFAAAIVSSLPYFVMIIRSDQELKGFMSRLLKKTGINVKIL